MTIQTRITIHSLKVAAFASEETTCFEAMIKFDGRIVGKASNDGHGGCTMTYPHGDLGLYNEAETFAKSLFTSEESRGFDPPLARLCDELVDAEQERKFRTSTLKRRMAKKVLFIRAGQVFHLTPRQKGVDVNSPNYLAMARETLGANVIILNSLPVNDAVAAATAVGLFG